MQRFSLVLLFLIFCSQFFGCESLPEVAAPLVQTGSVDVLNTGGVQFNGLVAREGSGESVVGFVWGENSQPMIGNGTTVDLGSQAEGPISVVVKQDLFPTTRYYVRAFGKSGNAVIYGEIMSFYSRGGEDPFIESFEPLEGRRGTLITVKGKNFSSTVSRVSAKLDQTTITVVEASAEQLTLKVPDLFPFSGSFKITVTVAGKTATSIQEFKIIGLSINNFEPTICFSGDTIKVNGTGFDTNAAGNLFLIGDKPCTVLSATETQLEVRVSPDLQPGSYLMFLTVNGISTQTIHPLTIKGNWRLITVTAGPTPRNAGLSFVVDNTVYYGLGVDGNINKTYGDFWKYNSLTNTWTQLADFPGGPRFSAMSFTINGKGYVGMGHTLDYNEPYKDLWEYDPQTNQWTQKTSLPVFGRVSPVTFSIGGKGYVGVGTNNYRGIFLKDFWEYDPVSNAWTQKKTFPGFGRGGSFVSYVINGRGYYGLGTSSEVGDARIGDFWEYNPVADTWTRKNDFPSGGPILAASFLLDGRAFVAGGGTTQVVADCWEYNPTEDSWVPRQSTPYAFVAGTGFTVNNKGFILFPSLPGGILANQLLEFNLNP